MISEHRKVNGSPAAKESDRGRGEESAHHTKIARCGAGSAELTSARLARADFTEAFY
jgi:hypothetical protein